MSSGNFIGSEIQQGIFGGLIFGLGIFGISLQALKFYGGIQLIEYNHFSMSS